jgi:hypothetical protein
MKEHWPQFLLSFFEDKGMNDSKTINGFVLFKHWDGNNKVWRVDLFTPESFSKLMDHLPPIQESLIET